MEASSVARPGHLASLLCLDPEEDKLSAGVEG